MLHQKSLDVGPEGPPWRFKAGREGKKITEIGSDSPLHSLQRSSVDNHISGAWIQVGGA